MSVIVVQSYTLKTNMSTALPLSVEQSFAHCHQLFTGFIEEQDEMKSEFCEQYMLVQIQGPTDESQSNELIACQLAFERAYIEILKCQVNTLAAAVYSLPGE